MKLSLLLAVSAFIGAGWFLGADEQDRTSFDRTHLHDARTTAHTTAPSHWNDSPFGSGAPSGPDPATTSGLDQPTPFPIFGRNGRPMDFGGKTAVQFIALSSAAARAGNIDAAYATYHAESVCASMDDPTPEFKESADHRDFVRERRGLESLCAGVTPAQKLERLQYLVTAARAGKVAAQIDFYMEGLHRHRDSEVDSRPDADTSQWNSDALAYLQSAASQGDAFALGLLAQAYDAGGIAPQDAKKALSFSVAESMARHHLLTPEQLQRRFGNALSADDFRLAWQDGMRIAKQCCDR